MTHANLEHNSKDVILERVDYFGIILKLGGMGMSTSVLVVGHCFYSNKIFDINFRKIINSLQIQIREAAKKVSFIKGRAIMALTPPPHPFKLIGRRNIGRRKKS